mmetsp:Transcript_36848/g.57910  ORF Transcript_36848/g.57910 Transcript_36848/m.57910 type:complete len:387 (-) Transcript_36848:118-1278(-)
MEPGQKPKLGADFFGSGAPQQPQQQQQQQQQTHYHPRGNQYQRGHHHGYSSRGRGRKNPNYWDNGQNPPPSVDQVTEQAKNLHLTSMSEYPPPGTTPAPSQGQPQGGAWTQTPPTQGIQQQQQSRQQPAGQQGKDGEFVPSLVDYNPNTPFYSPDSSPIPNDYNPPAMKMPAPAAPQDLFQTAEPNVLYSPSTNMFFSVYGNGLVPLPYHQFGMEGGKGSTGSSPSYPPTSSPSHPPSSHSSHSGSSHSSKKSIPCKNWAKSGSCSYGSNCRYYHPSDSNAPPPGGGSVGAGPPPTDYKSDDFENWLKKNNQSLTEEEEIQLAMDEYLDSQKEDLSSAMEKEGEETNLIDGCLCYRADCNGKLVANETKQYFICSECGTLSTNKPS